jgi:hypothetical protein
MRVRWLIRKSQEVEVFHQFGTVSSAYSHAIFLIVIVVTFFLALSCCHVERPVNERTTRGLFIKRTHDYFTRRFAVGAESNDLIEERSNPGEAEVYAITWDSYNVGQSSGLKEVTEELNGALELG